MMDSVRSASATVRRRHAGRWAVTSLALFTAGCEPQARRIDGEIEFESSVPSSTRECPDGTSLQATSLGSIPPLHGPDVIAARHRSGTASAVADTSGLWLVTRNNAFTNSATYMEQHRYTTDAPPRSVNLAGNHKPEEITGFFHRFEADFDGFLLAVDSLAPKYTGVELVTPATDLELEFSADYLIGPSGWHRRLMFSNAGVPMLSLIHI